MSVFGNLQPREIRRNPLGPSSRPGGEASRSDESPSSAYTSPIFHIDFCGRNKKKNKSAHAARGIITSRPSLLFCMI